MTSTKRRLASFVPLLVALAVPGVAHAQRSAQDIESARQLYHQGLELRERGDLKGALEKLRAAHALGNTPITGIELCKTHAALRQPVEAREVCLGVARIPVLAQETARSQEARTEAGKIAEGERAKIGTLRIKITGVPAGWDPTVTVDGAVVPPAALHEPRAVNPGPHVVTAKVGSGPETKGSLETREGETREIEMVVQAPPAGEQPVPVVAQPAPGARPAEQPPRREQRTNALPIVMFSIAGVSALIGAGAGLAAINGESKLADRCIDKRCGTELHDDLESAERWGNVSTGMFIVSGVALGAGLIALAATSSSRTGSTAARSRTARHVTPIFGIGGIGLDARF